MHFMYLLAFYFCQLGKLKFAAENRDKLECLCTLKRATFHLKSVKHCAPDAGILAIKMYQNVI